eukprot:362507-Chlamydomonas_euryale.AAC.2
MSAAQAIMALAEVALALVASSCSCWRCRACVQGVCGVPDPCMHACVRAWETRMACLSHACMARDKIARGPCPWPAMPLACKLKSRGGWEESGQGGDGERESGVGRAQ